MTKKSQNRTTQGLRDILFDEIAALRGEDGDPKRAAQVANLSKQIIGTAKLELEFQRTAAQMQREGIVTKGLGALALGTS